MCKYHLVFRDQIYLTDLTCDDVQVLRDCRRSCDSTYLISIPDWCQAQPLHGVHNSCCRWHACWNGFCRSLGRFHMSHVTWRHHRVSTKSCRMWASRLASLHCYYKHTETDGFLIKIKNTHWKFKKKIPLWKVIKHTTPQFTRLIRPYYLAVECPQDVIVGLSCAQRPL